MRDERRERQINWREIKRGKGRVESEGREEGDRERRGLTPTVKGRDSERIQRERQRWTWERVRERDGKKRK